MLHLIKKSSLIVSLGVLFTCVLLGLSSAPIYAASGEDPSPEVSSFDLVIPEEYLDPVYDKLASGDVRAVEYTTTDIYNLLSSALNGSSYLSAYSLPQIASQVRRISETLYGSGQSVPATSLYSMLNTSLSRFNNMYSDYLYTLGPGGQGFFSMGDEAFRVIYDDLPLIYSSAQQIHADGQNNSYYLSQINSNLSSEHSIPWSSYGNYIGTSLGLDNSYLSSNGSSLTYYFTFKPTSNEYQPSIFYFDLPVYTNVDQYTISDYDPQITVYFTNSNFSWVRQFPNVRYSVELRDRRFFRVYLYDLPVKELSYQFTIKMTTNFAQYFTTSSSCSFMYLPSSSEYFYTVLDNYYLSHFQSLSDSVSSLSNYLVSPEKQSAETASQPVIDDTLDGFTGNGSAAAKTSDTGGMKNMSGSIQSGLDTGASASNAASVFSNTTFWTWFTQDNANKINQPYPAPSVPQLRGSGDQIVDFLSGNQQELDSLLNQRNSW